MEGLAYSQISRIPYLTRAQVSQLVQGESADKEVTKSLLNLLHNIIRVASVPVSLSQRQFFDDNSAIVLKLLNKSISLSWKKREFEQKPEFAIQIAASCPTTNGS